MGKLYVKNAIEKQIRLERGYIMTPPKKEEPIRNTVYVEIGPNLKSVLCSMVDKVYNCSLDSTYYKMAFEPIYQIIKRLVDQKKGDLE